MAESYKRLGAIAPVDNREYLLYASPAATQALVSNITVTNRSASDTTFDINVYESGITQQSDLDDVINGPGFVSYSISYAINKVLATEDGETWYQYDTPFSNTMRIAYNNGKFVAFSSGSSVGGYSTDGTTWTLTSLPSASPWRRAAYGNGIFLITTYSSSSNVAASSTDGITWTARTLPSSSRWGPVVYGNNIFVVIEKNFSVTPTVAYSTDAITWSTSTMPFNRFWDVAAYGNNTFVALPYENPGVTENSYSTDGITWVGGTFSFPARWASVTFGNGKFVAVASQEATGAYSTDGVNWTRSTLPPTWFYSVAFNNDTFVATSRPGTNQSTSPVATSTDGITWTQVATSPTAFFIDVTAGDIVGLYSSPNLNNIYKSCSISANETLVLEPGIALGPQGAIVVKDRSGGNLTFSTYGVELS